MDKLAAYLPICTQTWGALCLLCHKPTWLEPRVRFVQEFWSFFFALIRNSYHLLSMVFYYCRLNVEVKEKLVLCMGMSSGKRFHKFDILNLTGLLSFFALFLIFTMCFPILRSPIECSYSTFMLNSNSPTSHSCATSFRTMAHEFRSN